MQVRYVEDLASHDSPKDSIRGRPRGRRRSVDRGRRGRSHEPRKVFIRSADAVRERKATRGGASRRVPPRLCVVIRPPARVEAICTGTGRSTGWPSGLVRPAGPHRQGQWLQSDDARPGEVRLAHSTREAAEQGPVGGRGGGGGKGQGRGRRRARQHAPDAELGKRIPGNGPRTLRRKAVTRIRLTALLHHVNVDLLRFAFHQLKRKAARASTASPGTSTRRISRPTSRVCMDAYSRAPIGRSRHGGSTSPSRTAGNGRSVSPHWRTRSSSARWWRC